MGRWDSGRLGNVSVWLSGPVGSLDAIFSRDGRVLVAVLSAKSGSGLLRNDHRTTKPPACARVRFHLQCIIFLTLFAAMGWDKTLKLALGPSSSCAPSLLPVPPTQLLRSPSTDPGIACSRPFFLPTQSSESFHNTSHQWRRSGTLSVSL